MTRQPDAGGISRRALFAIAGSGVAVASIASLWRRRSSGAAVALREPQEAPITYADYQGWMVTPAEKAALAGAPGAPPPASRR